MTTFDADEVVKSAEQNRERLKNYTRPAAEYFHEREGEMIQKSEAMAGLKSELEVDTRMANSLIAELTGDLVDPIVQIRTEGEKFVGIIDYHEFDGAYGYEDYDDIEGVRKRVVCAECVKRNESDKAVTHATAGGVDSSFEKGVDYQTLLEAVHEHYEDAHDGVKPEDVETGAILLSGTTIGGNTAWHAGNDGSGSNLDADELDGLESTRYLKKGNLATTFNQPTQGTNGWRANPEAGPIFVCADLQVASTTDLTYTLDLRDETDTELNGVLKQGTDADTEDEMGFSFIVPEGWDYNIKDNDIDGGINSIYEFVL